MSSRAQKAIERNRQLRSRKDSLKKRVKQPSNTYPKFRGVILPPILHKPSIVDRAMQWYFNGFVMSFGDGLMIVDPGVDFYSRFTATGHNIKQVRSIFVSHSHLDHCSDLTVLLDIVAKTETKIDLLLSSSVISDFLPSYYRELINKSPNINLFTMGERTSKKLVGCHWPLVQKLKPIELLHSAPNTYGFLIESSTAEAVAYVSDTGYSLKIQTEHGLQSPDQRHKDFGGITEKNVSLKQALSRATFAVVNINDLFYNRHSLTHLSGWDVKDMLEGSTVNKLVLQHLSPYNARGLNANDLYRDFFHDENYTCYVPKGAMQRIAF